LSLDQRGPIFKNNFRLKVLFTNRKSLQINLSEILLDIRDSKAQEDIFWLNKRFESSQRHSLHKSDMISL